jgi:formylglycine-generating enzyme required for sulfatase activity
MVLVEGTLCIDRYEASRPDATATYRGSIESHATSRANVLPWYPVTFETARDACLCAGKRLCTPDEFLTSCQGPDQTVYAYGDDFDPVICNSIDTYCRCGAGTPCEGISPCPYPHCYNQPPEGETEPAAGCGAMAHVDPTGFYADCTNEYGLYDINGNVWELVDDGTANGHFRGGAYNCIDSERLHRCDFVATNISARGFRCCRDAQ